MIQTVSVLDLKRGDTIVVVPGTGKHRGQSEDAGIIDVMVSATQSSAALGRYTHGEHARRRPNAPYVTFTGCGNDWVEADVFSVPYDTELVVMR